MRKAVVADGRFALVLVVLAGCGPSDAELSSQAAEQALQSVRRFSEPVVLKVPADAAATIAALTAQGAVMDFSVARRINGCNERGYATKGGSLTDLLQRHGYSISGYQVNPSVFKQWMTAHNYVQFVTFNKTIVNSPWGNIPREYVCLSNGAALAPHLGNVHSGGKVVLGQRQFAGWTYQQSYKTPYPGKGDVKVFAGTLSFRIEPSLPTVSFSGEGSATIKVHLDPDRGSWVVDEYQQLKAPSLTLGERP